METKGRAVSYQASTAAEISAGAQGITDKELLSLSDRRSYLIMRAIGGDAVVSFVDPGSSAHTASNDVTIPDKEQMAFDFSGRVWLRSGTVHVVEAF